MAENLDSDQPIGEVDPDTQEIKATPYFEDYLFQIIEALGGEGSTDAENATQLSALHESLRSSVAKIPELERKTDDLSQLLVGNINLLPRIEEIKRSSEETEQLNAMLLSEISLIKAQLTKLQSRFDDLEQLNAIH